MAYDAKLAERIDEILKATSGLSSKKMFGGLCYLINGNMLCGVDNKSRLMVRVGSEQYADVLKMKNTTKMTFTGKPLKGFIYVKPAGLKSKRDLSKWIRLALNFINSLPAKEKEESTPNDSIRKAKNIGIKTAAELDSIGVRTLSDLRTNGWEEVFEKLIETYPNRLNLNMAYALIGAAEDYDWRELPPILKSQAKQLVKSWKELK